MKQVLLTICILLSTQFVHSQGDRTDSLSYSGSQQGINRTRLKTAIVTESSLYLGSMSYLQFVWYKDQERVPFHLYDDRKGYLQMDKFGHAYGAYVESHLSYKWLRYAGVSKKNALLYGATLGIVLQAPIEVFDGLYENWGFSWSDILANTSGSMLVIAQEAFFDRQVVHYKFSFSRSSYAPLSNGYLGDNTLESLFLDYNGQTYWLSMNIHEMGLKQNIVPWLSIAVGYSANGMYGEFENRSSWNGVALPMAERYRQFIISPDIDWTKIPTDRKWLKAIFHSLNYIKFPAPALELDSRGKWRTYWLYF